MKAKIDMIRPLLNNKCELVLTARIGESEANNLVKLQEFDEVNVEIKKVSKKRSLNANAYFHVLCSKIAEKMNSSLDDIKKQEVLRYGSVATDGNGVAIYIRLPASVDVEQFYPYAQFIGESEGTKRPCYDYLLFKQTHTLDSSEMAKLIDGVVQDAKDLGIDTMTPSELAEMLSREEQICLQ